MFCNALAYPECKNDSPISYLYFDDSRQPTHTVRSTSRSVGSWVRSQKLLAFIWFSVAPVIIFLTHTGTTEQTGNAKHSPSLAPHTPIDKTFTKTINKRQGNGWILYMLSCQSPFYASPIQNEVRRC